MNILFLVTTFLLTFTFLSATLLKNSLFFYSEQKTFCSYITSKKNLHNKHEAYKYKKYTTPKKSKEKQENSAPKVEKIDASYTSHRLRQNPSILSKWNLAPLIFATKPIPYIQEGAASLLEELYKHTAFWKKAEKQIPDLSTVLLYCFKGKKDSIERISDIFPNDPTLHILFYKMLKGSSIYDVETKKGYPPLEDFFCLDTENKKTLYFSYASKPALKALFGDLLGEEIVSLEKSKWESKGFGHPSATQEELIHLASIKEPSLPIQEIQSQIDFSHKKVLLENLTEKNNQGVVLKVPLSKNKSNP